MVDLLERLRAELDARVDPGFRAGLLEFFREPVEAWGVRAPEVHKVAALAWREVKTWPAARRNRLCDRLWKSAQLEEASIAIYVYRRLHARCGVAEFRLFERWIDRYVRNWANCDGVASWLVAACLENEPALLARLSNWTRSRNRWKRRAAAVALIQEAKQGRHTAEIFQVAALLLHDRDDKVQKGVGWLLKETYPKQPCAVLEFLEGNPAAPRLVVRLAAEKMTSAHRARVLGCKPAAVGIGSSPCASEQL